MFDLEEIDRKSYLRELKRHIPYFVLTAVFVVLAVVAWEEFPLALALILTSIFSAYATLHAAKKKALAKRFKNPYFELRWNNCKDRVERFNSLMKSVPQTRNGALTEVPRTIETVSTELYRTLRTADIVAEELRVSEGMHYNEPIKNETTYAGGGYVPDRQSNELWVAADKNRAEYLQRIKNVQVSIVRSDAQVEVFLTAMDALRLNLMGLKLTPSRDDHSSYALLSSMAEVKLQMASITSALEELDFSIYPKTISVDGHRTSHDPVLPGDAGEESSPADAAPRNPDAPIDTDRKSPPPFRPRD